jgi:hypothetical protein
LFFLSSFVKCLNKSFYSDPWSIVAFAFILRYPNPYASHVVSCDVISRTLTPQGSLLTTRLVLKRGALPRWAPQGIVSRAESWVVEESEVDSLGKIVRCRTRNLDHVKVMQVEESVFFRQSEDGYVIFQDPRSSYSSLFYSKTLQTTEARIVSGFGWGLTKRIENYGLTRFKANVQRVCIVITVFFPSPTYTSFTVSRGRVPHSQSLASVSPTTHDRHGNRTFDFL